MKRFAPILFSSAAVVFGIIFVVVGIRTLATKDLYDSNVTATIVDIEEEWQTATDPDEADHLEKTAYVDYEINGQKYEHVLSPVQDDNFNVGDTVELLYQSKDPTKISGQNITSGGIAFIAVGAIVAVGGCISTLRIFIRRR